MIGLGAKYLKAAGFGRYRITAASLGSLDLLGTLGGWLMPATRQAIMDAFGVDGTAVIAATNEYLNGIAASDKAKATALAALINEDPMMVCSLGLEPTLTTLPAMPIRWLYGAGSAYFKIGVLASNEFTMKTKVNVVNSYSGEKDFFGNISSGRQFCIGYWGQGWFFYNTQTNSTVALGSQGIKDIEASYSLTQSSKNLKVNGSDDPKSISVSVINNSELCIMAGGIGYNIWRDYLAFLQFNDGTAREFLPIKRNGAMELIDIISGNLATKVGTITENYTLADGVTPWTPPTP